MKEITREDWQKNPTPRMMWVWDCNERDKIKRLVLHYFSAEDARCHFVAVDDTNKTVSYWKHCAEIEEKRTRLNNYEMGQLLKCFGVEWKYKCNAFTDTAWCYTSEEAMEIPALEELKIRYNQGEWEEPTREIVRKWCGDELYSNDIERFISFIGWDKE